MNKNDQSGSEPILRGPELDLIPLLPAEHESGCIDRHNPCRKREGANVGGGIAKESEGAKITPHPLEEAKATFRKWLEFPDGNLLDFMYGVVLANRLGGDPVWGGIVGASGDTKTEVLRSLVHPDMFHLSNLTAKTLISGLPNSMNVNKSGEEEETSLLPQLNGKILVIKDLTPLISGNRETRGEVLGQLRDAYDGSSAMAFGTGKVKRFESKFGMLFGVTPVIESCWPVINSLGERFIYYRCADGNSMAKVQAALNNSNNKDEMRKELIEASKKVIEQRMPDDIEVSKAIREQIAHLADFVAKARSPVKRDGRTEEISYAPVPEVGTRLGAQFIQLARGITAARGSNSCDDSVMKVVRHVAVSGIPRNRWRAIQELWKTTEPLGTAHIGQELRLSSGTVHRPLEDLWAFKLVDRLPGSSHKWALSDLARERLTQARLDEE